MAMLPWISLPAKDDGRPVEDYWVWDDRYEHIALEHRIAGHKIAIDRFPGLTPERRAAMLAHLAELETQARLMQL